MIYRAYTHIHTHEYYFNFYVEYTHTCTQILFQFLCKISHVYFSDIRFALLTQFASLYILIFYSIAF